jgi:Tol biopolymer transport system component
MRVRRTLLRAPLLLSILLISALAPFMSTPANAQENERCFAETDFCISGRFLEFWEQNNGLRVFGLPISAQQEELVEGRPLQVQWFERNRLELHLDNAPPYDVLLGRLGNTVLESRGRDWFTFPRDEGLRTDCRLFTTGFNVCGEILAAWQANGLELDGRAGSSPEESLALFGQPLSPAQTEVIDGKACTVQWFERTRFEVHPENQPPFNVQFGLLGNLLRPRDIPTPPGRIAFLGNGPNVPDINGNAIYTINPDGTERRLVSTVDPSASEASSASDERWFLILAYDWTQDGSRFVFNATTVWNPKTGGDDAPNIYTVAGDGSNQVRLTDGGAYRVLAIGADGASIAAVDSMGEGPQSIVLIDPESQQRRSLTFDGTDLYSIRSLTLSPDGKQMAFTALSNPAGEASEYDLYIASVDGSSLVRVRENISNNYARLAWSPDGTQLAINPNADGGMTYIINRDGSGQRNLFPINRPVGGPKWSPDGTRLLFYGQNLYVVNADGRGLTTFADGFSAVASADWSPDGQRIVFAGRQPVTGPSSVYVTAVANPAPQIIAEYGVNVLWRQVE